MVSTVLGRASLGFMLVALMSFASFAKAAGCAGTFIRDSQGYLASEGGAEPTADRRKKNHTGIFLYFDIMDGERFYRLENGDEHKAKAVKLAPGCKLPRLRPGGKY